MQVPGEDALAGVRGVEGLRPEEVGVPDEVVLREGESLQGQVENPAGFGDVSLGDQEVQVVQPDLRHQVHVREGTLVQGVS